MGRAPSCASMTTAFGAVRLAALADLNKGAWARTQWRPCVWQGYAESLHVAPYCNTLSHLETLNDLLAHGTWCDDLVLGPWLDHSDEAEQVFRYYSMALLVWSETVGDLRLIHGAARTGSGKVQKVPVTEPLMRYINHVFKHRGTPDAGGAVFHTLHHHGPYVFADAAGFRAAVPSDGVYLGVEHNPLAPTSGPVPLLLPSLPGAMRVLGAALRATSTLLRDASARGRVAGVYGTHRY